MKIQYFLLFLTIFQLKILCEEENNNQSEEVLNNNDANKQIIQDEFDIEDSIEYSKIIQQFKEEIQQKNAQKAINSTISIFTQIFSGMQQCAENYNKTKIVKFLNKLNFTFTKQVKISQTTNIVILCNKVYEIYDTTIQTLIEMNEKNEFEFNEELKYFLGSIISDYFGLKEAGLFDQLIFIDSVALTRQSEYPSFEVQFVEFEEFEETMDHHFSLIQAINAIFEGKSLNTVFDYFEDIEMEQGEENDREKIQNKLLTVYWNQIKDAIESKGKAKIGWKKFYYQQILNIAKTLRDECHFFEREGLITKLERNQGIGKKYLPNIQCEYQVGKKSEKKNEEL